jgi:ankyrin repeat protein
MIFLLVMLSTLGLSVGCAATMDMPSNISKRAGEAFSDPQARALAEAAARGNSREMERLVKAGADVNAKGSLGITPAWWAIRNRNKAGFAWLLEHGADPNPDVDSITVLEMAAGYEDTAFLETALKYKPDIDKAGRYTGHTPLSTAVMYSRRRNIELLINAGVNLDEDRGQSPLSYAAGQARYEYVYQMLQAGADNGRISRNGLLALATTIGNRLIDPNTEAYEWRERVIRFLRNKGIEAHPPANESKRTKPLPADLR